MTSSTEKVREILMILEQNYKALRLQRPGDTDKEIRQRIQATSSDLDAFSRSHPTFFRKFTDRTVPSVVRDNIWYIVEQRILFETGTCSELEYATLVRDMVVRNCVHDNETR